MGRDDARSSCRLEVGRLEDVVVAVVVAAAEGLAYLIKYVTGFLKLACERSYNTNGGVDCQNTSLFLCC